MFKTISRLFAMTLAVVMMTTLSSAQDHFTEDFSGLPSTYTTGDVSLPSGNWTLTAVFGEQSSNSYNGTGKAARLNDDTPDASLATPAVNGITNISFYYRELNSGGGDFVLQKSVDGGAWIDLTTQSYAGEEFTLFEYEVNDESDNIRLRIVSDDNSGHLIIDEMTLGSYGGNGGGESNVILSSDFEGGTLEPWVSYSVASNRDWILDSFGGNSYAEANGWGGDEPSDDWLISPALNLSSYDFVQMTFENAKNFSGPDMMLKISTDYDGMGNPNDFTWEEIDFVKSTGGYAFVSNTIELNDYLQDGVYIAFHYISNGGAELWQVDNVLIEYIDAAPTVLFETDFEGGSLAPWTEYSVASNRDWQLDDFGGNNYAEMNGWGGDEPSNDWLISPELDLSPYNFVLFTFDNAKNFSGPDLMLKVSTDYDGISNPENFNWTEVEFNKSGGGYSFVTSEIDLSSFAVNGVYIAFHYISNGGAELWQIDNTIVEGLGEAPAPVPAPFDLSSGTYELEEWSASNAAGTYPESMIFRTTASTDPAVTDGDGSDYTRGYSETGGSRVNGLGSMGFSFVNTSSGTLGDAILALDTRTRTNIKVEWTGDLYQLFCDTDRDYRIRLQYRVGDAGDWKNVLNEDGTLVEWANTNYLDRQDWDYPYTQMGNEFRQSFSSYLPLEAEDQQYVQVRWRYYMNENTGFGGCRPELRVDDIAVSSETTVGNPTRLLPESVMPQTPMVGVPFDLVVRTVDGNDTPKNPNMNIPVYLTLIEGTGQLGGNVEAIIAQGRNYVVFKGLTYDKAENIRVRATTDDPFGLADGIIRFDVSAAPAVQLNLDPNAYVGITHPTARVEFLSANGEVNTQYSGFEVTLDVNGPENSTYTAEVFEGVALFDGITFNQEGAYTATATAEYLEASNTVDVTVNPAPVLVEHMIPMYAKGEGTFLPDGNGRMPAWALVEFTNLHPNTTYRFLTSGGDQFDIDNDRFGGGVNIHYNAATDTYNYNSNRDFGTDGAYSTFMTGEGETSKKVWVNIVPSANDAFSHGTEFTWIVYLANNEGFQISRFETENKTQSRRLGNANDELSGFYDDMSGMTPRNMVVVWDDMDGEGRPLTVAMVQDEGSTLQNIGFPHLAPDFYANLDDMDGGFATFLPNNLSNGVRLIQEVGADGMAINEWTDEDGDWAGVDTKDMFWGMNPPSNPGFEIPRINLITPMNGEGICNNDPFNVTWESYGMETINIEIWVNGSIQETITDVNARAQMFDWQIIRDTYSNQEIDVRVVGANEFTYVSDQSGAIRIYDSPQILDFTDSRVYCEGDDIQLGVTSDGDDITYQWYKDGVVIEGANETLYNITDAEYYHSGVYTVGIVGAEGICNSVMTDGIGVYIARDTDLTIEELPQDANVLPGATARFQVKPHVNVSYPGYEITYQWYEVVDGGEDIALNEGDYAGRLAGANASVMTIVDMNDQVFGKRWYVVVNGLCDVTLTSGVVTANEVDLSITQGIEDTEACSGTDVVMTIEAESTGGDIEYQWFKDGMPLANNQTYAGVMTNELTITNAQATEAGMYSVRVTLTNNPVAFDTDDANLTVTQAPEIISQSDAAVTVEPGNEVTLEVEAIGDNLTYQWFSGARPIEGETNPTYTITNADAATHDGDYTCVVGSASCGSVTSDLITVTVTSGTPLSVNEVNKDGYSLSGVSPNPVSDAATIEFSVPTTEQVSINLIDARGNLVAVLFSNIATGNQVIELNVNDYNLTSGTYFYSLETANVRLTQPMIIVK